MSEWVRQLSGVRPGVIRGVKISSQMAYRRGVTLGRVFRFWCGLKGLCPAECHFRRCQVHSIPVHFRPALSTLGTEFHHESTLRVEDAAHPGAPPGAVALTIFVEPADGQVLTPPSKTRRILPGERPPPVP